MDVIIACEFSGIVRDAFIAQGHNAVSCDLLPSERPGPHIQTDIQTVDLTQFELLIAHPPCTYLTNAGVRHLHSVANRNGKVAEVHGADRWEAMWESAEFFNWLAAAPTAKIAIENPIPHGYAREFIGCYTQKIQPWMFGHGETKATCLWLKGLSKLVPFTDQDNFTNIEARAHRESPSPGRWKNRSRTFEGIAAAMAEQWS